LARKGVADILNKKLAIALAASDSTAESEEQGKPEFAQIAYDAAGLTELLHGARIHGAGLHSPPSWYNGGRP
jgi:hypothetical protein